MEFLLALFFFPVSIPCPYEYCFFGVSGVVAPDHLKPIKGSPEYWRDYCNAGLC